MYICKSWTIKKAEPRIIDAFELCVGEDSRDPLDCKETQTVHPKRNQSWIFIGRIDAEVGQNFGHLMQRVDSFDAGKDWRVEEKGETEDEMAEWYHQLNGHEFELTPGVGDGQRRLAYYSPWGWRVGLYWATELNKLE